MLVTMVDTCIKLLNDLSSVVSLIRVTAARHAKYGVVPAHFPVVGTVLLEALEEADQEFWSDRLRLAWSNLYQILAGMMITAMQEIQHQDALFDPSSTVPPTHARGLSSLSDSAVLERDTKDPLLNPNYREPGRVDPGSGGSSPDSSQRTVAIKMTRKGGTKGGKKRCHCVIL